MASEDRITEAVRMLEAGGLVAFPTETVYGLGADADNEQAVARVFAAKRRPTWHPLIVHLPDADSIPFWASRVPPEALRLTEAFWPGPLTIVLPKAERCGSWVTGGQDSVALRCPSHPLARALFSAFSGSAKRGVVGPSANSFGRISPTTASHVIADLGSKVDYVLDGGPCTVGIESTIVGLTGTGPELLRRGEITREMLEEVLGRSVPDAGKASPRVSGQLKSHYAPRTPSTLVPAGMVAETASSLEPAAVAILAPREALPNRPANAILVIEAPDDEHEYAAALYANLHRLDGSGASAIIIARPPESPRWSAVNDRLGRATARGMRGRSGD